MTVVPWRRVGDSATVISALVKLSTGVTEIDPAAYLQQAREIFAKGKVAANSLTHPESYIRAYALDLWQRERDACEPSITRAIEGELRLNALDLLAQVGVEAMTRKLIDELLSHSWFRSEPVLAHAALYFDDYRWNVESKRLSKEEVSSGDTDLHHYLCYVMLDFVTSDRDLDELPMAAALEVAERLGVLDPFKEIARKELRLRKKQIEELTKTKRKRLEEASPSNAEK